MPVTEDIDEAPYVYGFLADLVQANSPHILGDNNANLPRVVAIIAEAVAVDVLPTESEERRRVIEIVKQIQVKFLPLLEYHPSHKQSFRLYNLYIEI